MDNWWSIALLMRREKSPCGFEPHRVLQYAPMPEWSLVSPAKRMHVSSILTRRSILKGKNMKSDSDIFVFGSNLAGIHGAGAADYAYRELGAQWGVGEGLTGLCYALPTKDYEIQTLPLWFIEERVQVFLSVARENADLTFKVTPVGTGLAGYAREQIAPFFKDAPSNCYFEDENGDDWIEGLTS